MRPGEGKWDMQMQARLNSCMHANVLHGGMATRFTFTVPWQELGQGMRGTGVRPEGAEVWQERGQETRNSLLEESASLNL